MSAHEKTNKIDQNKIDQITAARIINDAELLKDGAQIVNGVFFVTDAQKEALKREHEVDTDREFGRLALYSDLDEKTARSVEDIVGDAENLTRLLSGIAIIAEPYGTVFDAHIPGPSKDDRNWRGQLKDAVTFDSWSESRTFNHSTATYSFEGSYRPGATVNFLKKISIDIKDIGEESKREPAIRETLEYDGINLKSIEFIIRERNQAVVSNDQLMQKGLGSLDTFLGQMGIVNRQYVKGGKIKISFDKNSIVLTGKSERWIPGFTYTYNPDQRTFYGDPETASVDSFPKEIDEDHFSGIVADILKFIPTKPVEA
jgi:hypothetical protein